MPNKQQFVCSRQKERLCECLYREFLYFNWTSYLFSCPMESNLGSLISAPTVPSPTIIHSFHSSWLGFHLGRLHSIEAWPKAGGREGWCLYAPLHHHYFLRVILFERIGSCCLFLSRGVGRRTLGLSSSACSLLCPLGMMETEKVTDPGPHQANCVLGSVARTSPGIGFRKVCHRSPFQKLQCVNAASGFGDSPS